MKTDTYKEPTTLRFPNMVVRVYRPELTQDEYTRRMKAIERAAADVLRAAEKN